MSWHTQLQDASFRGVRFDCQNTSDSTQRDTASHEYPYRDGADVEDLGRKARQVKLTAVLWGQDYERRLRQLIAALDLPGYGELVHPVFGSIRRAQLQDYQISHDAETPDHCTVAISFVEATPADPLFLLQLPQQLAEALAQLSKLARELGIEAFAEALDALRNAVPLSRLLALRQVLVGTLNSLRRLLPGSLIGALDPLVAPRGFAGDIVALLQNVATQPRFAEVGRQSDWRTLVSTLGSLGSLADQVASGAVGGDAQGAAQPIPAQADDVARLGALLKLVSATTLADTAAALLAAEAKAPSRSPQDIEMITDDVRTALQGALQAYRDRYPVEAARPVTEALKDVALGLQNAAIALIDARPPLITRRVEAASNLRLLAYRWYGDAERAAELTRLNPQLANPNALQAGDTLNAYAR